MSLPFSTLSAFAPLALSASQSHVFKRPVGSLSAEAYTFYVQGSTGVFRVSATTDQLPVSSALLSSAQVSAAATTFTFAPTLIDAGETITIDVVHLSGGIVPSLKVVANVGVSALGGQWDYVGSVFVAGSGNSGATTNPVFSATQYSHQTYTINTGTNLVLSAVTATTTLSTNTAVAGSIAYDAYIVAGDTIGFRTTIQPFSSLDYTSKTFAPAASRVDGSFPRGLTEHLRLRNQGSV